MLKIIEPVNQERRYKNAQKKNKDEWKEPLIQTFLDDLEKGINIKGSRGKRSYTRLNTLRSRLKNWEEWTYNEYKKRITKLTYKEIHNLYHKLSIGEIRRKDGERYKGFTDYGKDIKTFWSWYVRHTRSEEDKDLRNITLDLNTTDETTRDFNYLTYQQFEELVKEVKEKYRPLLWFLFDSGIRSPKELLNIRRRDISEDEDSGKLLLHIRGEYSKTFGRKIKLMLSSDIMRKYLEMNELKPFDQVFPISPPSINKMLSLKVNKLFGIGKKYIKKEKVKGEIINRTAIKNGFTLYDIRHCSACYWITKYKKESVLKYRFGWKKSDRIFYYTHFLGIEDDITEDDTYTETDKKKLENRLEALEQALLNITKSSLKTK